MFSTYSIQNYVQLKVSYWLKKRYFVHMHIFDTNTIHNCMLLKLRVYLIKSAHQMAVVKSALALHSQCGATLVDGSGNIFAGIDGSIL